MALYYVSQCFGFVHSDYFLTFSAVLFYFYFFWAVVWGGVGGVLLIFFLCFSSPCFIVLDTWSVSLTGCLGPRWVAVVVGIDHFASGAVVGGATTHE